jgi:hypothetical protein
VAQDRRVVADARVRASAAFSARNSLTKPSPTDSATITTVITAPLCSPAA